MADSALLPPPGVRGMTRLDRSAFQRPLVVYALRLPDANITPVLKLLKTLMLRVPQLRPVQSLSELPLMERTENGATGVRQPAVDCDRSPADNGGEAASSDPSEGGNQTSVMGGGQTPAVEGDRAPAVEGDMTPAVEGDRAADGSSAVDDNEAAATESSGEPTSVQKVVLLDPDCISDSGQLPWAGLEPLGLSAATSVRRLTLRLTYDNYRADAVLRAVLPAGQDGCTSFSRVGHLIHLNLKEHLLPFGQLIGQVLMDKHPGVRSVVNKLNTIDNTFRNFSMQLLAGEADYVVEARENGCSFRMDFSRVYWNPRLCTEHERLVALLQPADTLYDVCAGVGPFTVPAARKRCRVLANDLNPESFRWLQHNVAANKVSDRVETFNMDGREFIRTEVRCGLQRRLAAPEAGGGTLHAVLNLPALAIEFVDAFVGLLSAEEVPAGRTVPLRAHVYTFTKELETAERSVRAALNDNVGRDVGQYVREVFMVRNVAPNKLMYRVTWDVPLEVLCADPSEPAHKKARLAPASDSGENVWCRF